MRDNVKMDKVSIIIPCYNSQDYIKECVESALNQTYSNIEIIVVNDHSTDTSQILIDQFGNSIKSIEHTKNRGLAAALNTGILQSKGTWIKRLDSDDILTPHCVEVLMSNAWDRKILYYGDYELIRKDGKHLKFFVEPDRNNLSHYLWCEIVKEKHIGNADTMIYHKSIHDLVGPYNEDIKLGMDYEFLLRCILKHDMKMFRPSNLILAKYRIHNKSMMAFKARENSIGMNTYKKRRLNILNGVLTL